MVSRTGKTGIHQGMKNFWGNQEEIRKSVPGLKYLHSARILHRDIKPGNLLVNSNCVLKICDFGLARVEEPDSEKAMTQEVVTQYYRAPEILMGAKHYTAAVDVWSVGCIFGELLGRRILFQAQNAVQQLEMITDLLGTPTLIEMKFGLYMMLKNELALAMRLAIRTWMKVVYVTIPACVNAVSLPQMLLDNLPPILNQLHLIPLMICGRRNSLRYKEMHKFISEQLNPNRVPLCINPKSAAFISFASSTVARSYKLAPSPQQWE
ncbi:serine/threonine-protein kinase NLK [Bemisia tabaci]|uniref:serine/threonine-protein kinase NLK n=1 Tax=Bemisia tabaci TaxID=7038 RepID=UPI003B28824B